MYKGRYFIFVGLIFMLTVILLGLLSSFMKISSLLEIFIISIIFIIINYLIVKKNKTRSDKNSYFNHMTTRLVNIIVIITAIIVIILTPFFQSTWFYVKHITIFILIAFLICFNGYIISNNFIRNHQNKAKILKTVTLAMVFVGLILFGNLQLFYINNYEIPPLYGCSYYDDYGNLIYNSQIAGSCPDLENIEHTASELSFSVHEEIYRYDDDLIEDHITDQKVEYDSNITYQYDLLNRVTSYEINLTIEYYVFDDDIQDYKLFQDTSYTKTIDNIYEDTRFISNHHITNSVIRNNEYDSFSGYDYDIQYISELKPKEDSSDYKIDITRIIQEDNQTNNELLYNIDVLLEADEVDYIVNKTDKQEYLVLTKEERNNPFDENEYIIKKDYRASIYDYFQTEKELYFDNYQPLSTSNKQIYINDFSRHDPYYGSDMDFRNNSIIRTSEDGFFNQSFFNFTNIVEETNYGFKINHYHLQRENDLSYNTYPNTIEHSIDYPNNNLSIDLQSMNNYERALYYPDYYKFELVYQENPFLMSTYIAELRD